MALLNAGPFSWVDQAIQYGRFSEFVTFAFERDQDERLMNIWLHRVLKESYADWKKSLMPKVKPTKRQIEATVKNSAVIAAQIVPTDFE